MPASELFLQTLQITGENKTTFLQLWTTMWEKPTPGWKGERGRGRSQGNLFKRKKKGTIFTLSQTDKFDLSEASSTYGQRTHN